MGGSPSEIQHIKSIEDCQSLYQQLAITFGFETSVKGALGNHILTR